ncbi:MAG TPA: S24/S26 family peptidase [Polyangium sp.]|nr:S24/S26 family peptidase [Polyangium sp.]
MGWATGHITKLREGHTVSFRPRGNSMSPRIESGQLCTVEPVNSSDLRPGDIVLCKVRGTEYLHFVKAIQDGRFQIGNNRGHINGWIGANSIFGRLVKVES